MKYILLFLVLLWFHIVDDFYLQGVLTKMKQKDWWESLDSYTDFYRYDYIAALIMHGCSWSFTVHIPILVLSYLMSDWHTGVIALSIISNALIHIIVDNRKANQKVYNLVIDQTWHCIQLIYIIVIFAVNTSII